jgi:hypothetical protein
VDDNNHFVRDFKLLASIGGQDRKILSFVNNFAAHTQAASLPRNAEVSYYPPNCVSAYSITCINIMHQILGSPLHKKQEISNIARCMETAFYMFYILYL